MKKHTCSDYINILNHLDPFINYISYKDENYLDRISDGIDKFFICIRDLEKTKDIDIEKITRTSRKPSIELVFKSKDPENMSSTTCIFYG